MRNCEICFKPTNYRLINKRFQTGQYICYNCLKRKAENINLNILDNVFEVEVSLPNETKRFSCKEILNMENKPLPKPKVENADNTKSEEEDLQKKQRKKNIITAIIVAATLLLITCIPVFSSICFHSYYETYSSTSTSCNKVLKCSKCGKEKIISTESHTFSSETVSEDATCTHSGGTYHKCSKCGYKDYITETPALGHNYILEATETRYAQTNACTRCGTKMYNLITIDAYRESGYNYYTFHVKIKNYLYGKSLTFVKAKLYVLNSKGVIFTDWTYAISSMPLEYGEITSFEIMVDKTDVAGMEYFYFEYYN